MNVMTLIFITAVLPFAKLCPQGQFRPAFVDDCSDCPEDPETSCQYEGDDADACENACIIEGPNVTESTPRVPETTPKQPGKNSSVQEGFTQGPQGTPDPTKKNKDVDPPGTNPTMIAGILSAAIALVLLPIVGLAMYFHRRNPNNQSHPTAIENEHVEMENMQGTHEGNQQVLPLETDDREYIGPGTAFDLDKAERGSVLSLLETAV